MKPGPPMAPAVLIFDGDCLVCTSYANWARSHVKVAVEIAPWQRIDLAAYGSSAASKAYLTIFGACDAPASERRRPLSTAQAAT